MKVVRRTTSLLLLITAIAGFLKKRKYKQASVVCFVKRMIGFLISKILVIPSPQIVSGKGSSRQIACVLKQLNCKKPLIVTDKMLVDHGLVKPVMDSLGAEGLKVTVYDAVVPNPPSELVEEGHDLYAKNGCDSIIALGGGSPIDVAKVIGAKVANPSPDIESYQGYFMVSRFGWRPLPPLVAVPTTAGTGSEATVAAVITITKDNKKIAIADLGLVPHTAVLDPELLVKLPKGVTSATGMDALTHAVESYIGGWSSEFSRKNSLMATEKIFKNIIKSFEDGTDTTAREAMLLGSFEAGIAFTRAHVGYVHAIAHQFGGMFHTAHGVANAMLLPHVLDFYLQDEGEDSDCLRCTTQYCELAEVAGLAPGFDASRSSAAEKRAIARMFIARIAEMSSHMAIPAEVKEMKASDVEEVARRAMKEAHGEEHDFLKKPIFAILDLGYPVPKYMTHDECKHVIAKVLSAEEKLKYDGLGK